MKEMSSKNRVLSALRLETGIVPVIPLSTAFSAAQLGVKIPAMRENSKLNAEIQLKAWEKYGYDGVFTYSDLSMFWENMGGRIKISDVGFPSQEQMLSKIEDFENIRFPDLEKDGTLKEALKALEELSAKLGSNVPTLIGTVGAFTFAGAVRGIDFFMLDLMKKPALSQKLLYRCNEFLVSYVDELKRRGALIALISDPMASLISPNMYAKFAFPYQKDLFDKIRETGMYSILHICGDVISILDKMKESETDCLWLDQKIDLKLARRVLGSRCLMGNIDPVATLLRGSRKDVETEAMRCIDKASKTGGFILSAGCEIPIKTPPENLETLVETARNYRPQSEE